jgi:hypothetical protein
MDTSAPAIQLKRVFPYAMLGSISTVRVRADILEPTLKNREPHSGDMMKRLFGGLQTAPGGPHLYSDTGSKNKTQRHGGDFLFGGSTLKNSRLLCVAGSF